jgi:hypothetical protein
MSKESDHVAKLFAFFAMPPRARIDVVVASGWADRHDLEERTASKCLLRELELAIDTTHRYEPWWDALNTDSTDSELEALLSLIFVVTDRFSSEERRLFDSIEAMETEPEWRLVWRLVVRIAELLNITPSVDLNYVPALICGGDGT